MADKPVKVSGGKRFILKRFVNKASKMKPVYDISSDDGVKVRACECGHKENDHGNLYDEDGVAHGEPLCIGGLDVCECTKFRPIKKGRKRG